MHWPARVIFSISSIPGALITILFAFKYHVFREWIICLNLYVSFLDKHGWSGECRKHFCNKWMPLFICRNCFFFNALWAYNAPIYQTLEGIYGAELTRHILLSYRLHTRWGMVIRWGLGRWGEWYTVWYSNSGAGRGRNKTTSESFLVVIILILIWLGRCLKCDWQWKSQLILRSSWSADMILHSSFISCHFRDFRDMLV